MSADQLTRGPEGAANSRQRQREQTRWQILSAAAEVFARSGFEAASLAEIADRAGVKKALVQYHFSTKEQLWKDAAAFTWSERDAYLADALAVGTRGSADDDLRRGFTALVEFTREHPNWLWFMFHEAAVGGERMQWLLDNYVSCDYVMGEEFIRQCQAQGLMRDGPPLHLLHLITGALTYNLLVAKQTLLATGTDLSSEASIDIQVQLLADALAP